MLPPGDGVQRLIGRPCILVLDEGFMSGAHAALGLARAGCQVTVLAGTGGRGGHVGRNIRWSLAPEVGTAAFLQAVNVSLAAPFDYVYPMTETIQELLWCTDGRWSGNVYPPTEPWQRDLLRHKQRLAEYVARRGVAIPTQESVTPDDDLEAAARRLGMPLVVKGVRGRGGVATRIASSIADVVKAVRATTRTGVECFLQQYVSGPTYLVGGLFRAGDPIRIYAGRKLEQHPRTTGPATMMRSVHEPSLLEPALAVFRELRVSGLASVDFIATEDGPPRYLFLELNPRPWGSITAAADAGVDLFTPLAEMLAGAAPAVDLAYRVGVDSTVFPLYLLSRVRWRMGRAIGNAVHDLRGVQGTPWRSAGQAAHLLHRLYRVGRNWPRA